MSKKVTMKQISASEEYADDIGDMHTHLEGAISDLRMVIQDIYSPGKLVLLSAQKRAAFNRTLDKIEQAVCDLEEAEFIISDFCSDLQDRVWNARADMEDIV